MTRSSALAWLLLAVWSIWTFALQAWLGRAMGTWTPELGVVLLLSLAARLPTESLGAAALCVGLARVALSIDPVAAVLASCLGVVLAARLVRSVLELESSLVMAPLAGICTLGVVAWLALVRETRLEHSLSLADGALGDAARASLATALAALAVGPWMAYLPGLSPLKRSHPWSSADSVR